MVDDLFSKIWKLGGLLRISNSHLSSSLTNLIRTILPKLDDYFLLFHSTITAMLRHSGSNIPLPLDAKCR